MSWIFIQSIYSTLEISMTIINHIIRGLTEGQLDTQAKRNAISKRLANAYMAALVICGFLLFGGATAIHLGLSYVEEGHGLHPVLAGALGLGFILFAITSFNSFVELFAGFGDDDGDKGD
jgi:hypothetical protein